ncbi:MAG: hypothetical protein LJE65_06390 [Desulfobacteraceae bacterium]|nr:hypothetical protein [Desulfobacteraceae bacterium]
MDTDEVLKNRWWVRLFFAGTVLLFAGFVAYIITHPQPPGYALRSGGKASFPNDTGSFSPGDTVTIPKGKTVPVGGILITYLGVENGRIRMEVVVESLDPDYAYGFGIAADQAKAGFRSGGRAFRLLSFSGSRVRLRLLN